MSLAPGTRLGAYEVLVLLGAGGMGEVYRARDTRLGREVAIKVLPGAFLDDAELLSRFEREARSLAAVNHPGIAAIHSFEAVGDRRILVMELAEGEPLNKRIREGTVHLDEALVIARQIAEALEAAHERGIIHRDLKPANVMVSAECKVKLLDFGLAKAFESDPSSPEISHSPTVTAHGTATGVILGTAAYMSPEQARGKPVDKRTDVWAFGVVLYEMLTGKRLFRGDTVSDTLAAVLREPVDWKQLPGSTPRAVRNLLERCLERDPKQRLRDIGEARVALEHPASSGMIARTGLETAKRSAGRWLPWAIAAAAVAFGAFGTNRLRRVESPAVTARFEIPLPPGHVLENPYHAIALSADGKRLVYSASSMKSAFVWDEPKLYVRALDSWESSPIPGTDGGRQPVLSPDGKWVAFFVRDGARRFLRKVPVEGGSATTLCECNAEFGAAWLKDGSIVFASMLGPLQRVPETGGKPETVTQLDEKEDEVSHRLPHEFPGGRVVYTALRHMASSLPRWDLTRIWVQKPGSKERHLLIEGGSDARWVAPGILVLAREGVLAAARLASSGASLSGPVTPILEGISHSLDTGSYLTETGSAQLSVSDSGLAAYAPGSTVPEYPRALSWLDRSGRETPIEVPLGYYLYPRTSADGKRLLLVRNFRGAQVEIHDLERGTMRRVSFEGSHSGVAWGPGPSRVTFSSDHEGPRRLYVRLVDAPSGEVERLSTIEGGVQAGSWSPDGEVFVYTRLDSNLKFSSWLLRKGGEPKLLESSRFNVQWPSISPDGRWLAYCSDESGRFEVYVRSLADSGAPRMISTSGGREPLWARDGTALFYRVSGDPSPTGLGYDVTVYRVDVRRSGPEIDFERPTKLFTTVLGTATPVAGWDIAADGRFLVTKDPPEAVKTFYAKSNVDRIRVDLVGLPTLLEKAERRN